MKLCAFSVYDTAVGAFMPPFFVRSRGEALRSFQTVVNQPDHVFCKHPSDYVLFDLGWFDDSNGTFTQSVGSAVRVVSALECVMQPLGGEAKDPDEEAA